MIRSGLAVLALAIGLTHAILYHPSEPFYNGDEPRHVTTGIFVRDLIHDTPLRDPVAYAVRYYAQYPALGIPYFPPLFYVLEGAAMSLFGTSALVGRALVLIACFMACAYLFLLVLRSHGPRAALLAGLFLAIAPAPFTLSRYVMLEMPALAWSMAAIYYYTRYAETEKRGDLIGAALATAAAALTRFTAVFLIPMIGIHLLLTRRFHLLRRAEVVVAAAGAAALVLPYYILAACTSGHVHWPQIAGNAGVAGLGGVLWTYPSAVPGQLGWFLLVAALLGIAAIVAMREYRGTAPYLAMALATYLTVAPIGLRDPRFAVSWVPAFAFFAAYACDWVWNAGGRVAGILIAAIVLVGTGWLTWEAPRPFLVGYETAARYVLNNTTSPVCLFDGTLNGNFIYQIRRMDPSRRLWILRGDRTLYSITVSPEFGYREFSSTEADMATRLYRYDPELIVVEDPPIYFRTPAGDRLRNLLRDHPRRFHAVAEFPLQTNLPQVRGAMLRVYRNLVRNPNPDIRIRLEVDLLQRPLETDLPKRSSH
ncbi:MAG TPA: glycosyltransferase family 39 protein [Candidatus Limnocylindrales bacterium]|nr:glycosyltransferase family 39 protein [Candidatus Limnocylindrales bacterium]